MDSKHPVIVMGQTFGVLTGLAFIVSASLNALAFWLTWRMNYFLIASPADVIMSGFIMVSAVSILAAVLALVGWGVVKIKLALDADQAEREKKKAEAAAVLDDYVRVMSGRLKSYGVPDDEVETLVEGQRMSRRKDMDEFDKFSTMRGVLLLATLAISIGMGASELFTKVNSLAGTVGTTVTQRPWWYETGLRTAPEYTAFGGQCASAPVAWLGSSAAILQCRDRVRVIHKLDDLVTVSRYER